jgi:nicotinic acid mononucleotide adenylyltransferase
MEHVLAHHIDYAFFCPHSLNPDKKGILTPMFHRLRMMEILVDASPSGQRMGIIDPEFIEGMHGMLFLDLCHYLQHLGCYVSIVCGTDALMRTYCPELCALDHYLGIRDSYYNSETICKLIQGRVTFFSTTYTDMSSTSLREELVRAEQTSIDARLLRYIRENRLFE